MMIGEQLALPIEALVEPAYDANLSLQERYEAWRDANPWVLDVVETLVARWLAAGHRRVGIKQVWEVVRWQYGTTTGDRFKANNNWTSRVARDLIERRPEWAGAIEVRQLRAA